MKIALVLVLAFVAVMAKPQVHVVHRNPSAVNVVDRNPSEVHFVENDPSQVHFVENNPSQVHFVENDPSQVHVVEHNPGQVHVVDHNPSQVHVVEHNDQVNVANPDGGFVLDNVDPFFGQPHNPYPPNGGYEPISNGPALVDNYPYRPVKPLHSGARGGGSK